MRLRIPEIVTSFVFISSIFALSGFLFDSLEFLKIPLFFSAAVHTALLFLVGSLVAYILFRTNDEYGLSLKNWLVMSGILVLFLGFTMAASSTVDLFFLSESKQLFEKQISATVGQLDERLAVYTSTLEAGRGLFDASSSVEREEWKAFVDSIELQENYPGIQGLGYAVFVAPEEKTAHIKKIQSEGFPEYTIRPEDERDIYTSIVYLEPFDLRNRQAFGYDMFSNEIRRSAMEKARDSGEARMSGKITLVQEIDNDVQPGFLLYVPYYSKGSSRQTLGERRENIVGYIYAAFRSRDFVEAALARNIPEKIGIQIQDGDPKADEPILFSNIEEKIGLDTRSKFAKQVAFYGPGRVWTIDFASSEDFGDSRFREVVSLLIIFLGIAGSLLVSFVFYVLQSSRERAVAYANMVTKDLQKFKQAVDGTSDMIVITDPEGMVIYGNKAVESTTGYKVGEAVGKKAGTLWKTPMPQEFYEELWKTIKIDKKPFHAQLQNKRKNGTMYDAAVSLAPVLDKEGEIAFFVGIERNITKEKQIDRAKTEFVSLASHQLRTPLSTINWYAEMLLAGDAGELKGDQKKYLEEIYTGNQRMVALVNSLLNVSRLELGTFLIEPEKTDLRELSRAAIHDIQALVKGRNIIIKENYEDIGDIEVDKKLVNMIFQNLISNAVKYSKEGSEVLVTIAKVGEMARIQVADSGMGIPMHQQERVFQKLFRADNVRETDTTGTGLGLYIVKSVVENAGGKISFTSKEDEGTTFEVDIPLSGMKKKGGEKSLD